MRSVLLSSIWLVYLGLGEHTPKGAGGPSIEKPMVEHEPTAPFIW